MLTKDRLATMLKLALPITVGLGSSQLMVVIDLAMVGTLGNDTVAAVGLAGFIFTLVSAFVVGVSPAVQGIVARRAGENSAQAKCLPLNAGLLLVALIGAPLGILCYFLSPWFFSVVTSDPKVAQVGVPYLSVLFLALVVTGLENAFEGFWTGVNRAKVYMLNILFVNSLHIFLNYIFIFGNFGAPALGAMGAAISSVASSCVSILVYLAITWRNYRGEGFLTARPQWIDLNRIFTIGLPATMEAMFFSLGFVVFYWIVGQIGTSALAVTNVLVRVSLVLALFAQSLGIAAVTLVSNTLGKKDPAGAAAWGSDIAKLGVIWISLLGMPLLFFPEWCLSIFLSDPDTIAMGVVPAQLTGAFTGIVSLIYIFATVLVSLGDGKRVLMVSFATQWMFFLPAVWLVGPYLKHGLLEISYVQVAYGLIATCLITAIWRDGRWKRIEL